MYPNFVFRVFIAALLIAGLMGLPVPVSVAGAPVPPIPRLARADTAHPPQGLSAEERAGILRQVHQDERHPAAGSLTPSQVKKLVAGDGATGDASGISVAVRGDTVVVGTYHATVGGNLQRGAAYIYARNRGGASDHWGEVKKLTAPDGAAYDYFGIAVAISGDTVVIGASGADITGQINRGVAYVFARNQGGADQWGLVKKLLAGDGTAGDWFGDAVAISGGVIVVGADYTDIGGRADQGAAYVFARNQGGANQWGQIRKLTAGDGAAYHYFGGAVALSGDTAVVGAWGADVSGTLGQGAAYVFARNQGGADLWGQVKKLAAADGAAYDRFGYAVAINGQADAVVVGAYYANVGGAARQGAAYIFIRNQGGSPDNWGQVKKLAAGDGAANDYFGRAVAISGESAMVGAVGDDTGRGAAYLFVRNQDGANVWGPVQKLTAVDGAAGDNLGIAVAINEEADTFILGAPGDDSWKGAAYVFARQANNWVQQRKTTASDGAVNDQFGGSVAISGDTLVVGADRDDTYKGAAYILVRNWGGADQWGLVKKLTASDGVAYDYFSDSAVAISGDTVVVGAYGADISGSLQQGAAYVFARNQGGADQWGQVKKLTASDGADGDVFGDAVAISGDTVVVGAWGADSWKGAAYVFARNQDGANVWGQVQKLTASVGATYDHFGDGVAISGDTVVVGAYGDDSGKGAVYVFARNQGGADQWGQVKKFTASDGAANDHFGNAVAISGDTAVVGVDGDDSDRGAAYVFARNQGGSPDNWGQVRKLAASDSAANDHFGNAVAISGDTAVVGAYGDDSWKGAAYVFARNQSGADQWGQVQKLTAADGAADDIFGIAVAMSGDTVVVGADGDDSDRGATYVYQEAMSYSIYLPSVLKTGLSQG